MSALGNSDPTDITSVRNAVVTETLKLHRARERRKRGSTILEGPHLLAAAAGSSNPLEIVLALPQDHETRRLCGEHGVELRTVSEAVLARLAPTEHPRGPITVMRMPEAAHLEAVDTVVLLGIGDPGNAGTLIRSAAAFGFRVAVGHDGVDVWSPKVLRAGAGAHFIVGISVLGADPVAELRSAGLVVTAATPKGGMAPAVPPGGAIALMIGNEPRGLPEDVVAGAEVAVSIPIAAGIESLNAGVAGSILMYERARTRGPAGS